MEKKKKGDDRKEAEGKNDGEVWKEKEREGRKDKTDTEKAGGRGRYERGREEAKKADVKKNVEEITVPANVCGR